MIFQVFFTYALELVALAFGTMLIVLSGHDKFAFKRFAKVIGALIIICSVVLIFFTSYHFYSFLNRAPSNTNKAQSSKIQTIKPIQTINPGSVKTTSDPHKKPKLQLQVMPSGPTMGGIIKPTKNQTQNDE